MRRPPMALAAATIALILPILIVPGLAILAWSPRFAVLIVIAALGMPGVFALLRTRRRAPAAAAIGFGLWALVSAIASPERVSAMWGVFQFGTGFVFVSAIIGAWGIGVLSLETGAGLIETALLASVGANALLAVSQMTIDLSGLHLGLVEGRSPGFYGNPVYLAPLIIAGLWLLGCRLAQQSLWWAPAIVLAAMALQAAGGRSPLLLLIPAAVGLARRNGLRVAGAFIALVVVGLLLGAGLVSLHGGTSASARVTGAEATAGFRPRLESWVSAFHAIEHRPVLGEGPGNYRAATSRFHTLAMARTEGADRLFADAHNFVVEYATTTGILGLALLVTWLWLAFRSAGWESPLGGFALLGLAAALVEPQHPGLTPVLFLALGAAGASSEPVPRLVPSAIRVPAVAVSLGVSAILLTGFWRLDEATVDFSEAHASAARQLLPHWPFPRIQTAHIFLFKGITDRDPLLSAKGRIWLVAAARADPTDPATWNELGDAYLGAGLLDEAQRAFGEALAQNPWSARALSGLGHIALARGSTAEAVRYFTQSLRGEPGQAGVRRILRCIQSARGSEAVTSSPVPSMPCA